jgi:hypothetical protein
MDATLLRDEDAAARAEEPRAAEPPRATTVLPRPVALLVATLPRAPVVPRALLPERETDFDATLFLEDATPFLDRVAFFLVVPTLFLEVVDLAGALFFAAAFLVLFFAAAPLVTAERLLALFVDFFVADLAAVTLRPFDVAIDWLGILGMK